MLYYYKGFPTFPKKTDFLDKSSINIDILPSFLDRREVLRLRCTNCTLGMDLNAVDKAGQTAVHIGWLLRFIILPASLDCGLLFLFFFCLFDYHISPYPSQRRNMATTTLCDTFWRQEQSLQFKIGKLVEFS